LSVLSINLRTIQEKNDEFYYYIILFIGWMCNEMKKYGRIINIFIFFLVIYLGYSWVSQKIIINQQKREFDIQIAELDKVKKQNQELKDMVDMINENPEKWYEKQAREKLGLIKEGEISVLKSNDETNEK
jgi:cell division protein FtsB